MNLLTTIPWIATFISLWFILLFFLYPFIVFVLSFFLKAAPLKKQQGYLPNVTLLIVVRNGEKLIEAKLLNALSLRYPKNRLDIVVVSDGSTDNTVSIARTMAGERIRIFHQPDHQGKISAINDYFHACSGQIVVFTDVDAILETDAIAKLTACFADPKVGGVCGQRLIQQDMTRLTGAQKGYIAFDSLIKRLETVLGSITSNDGKLYAIRKELFLPIPAGVTDDMFVLLMVINQYYRFIFEESAMAFIKTPSRSTAHEIERRKRITTGSLKGIKINHTLLNPFKHGLFAFQLFINKVNRRLNPLFLLIMLFSSGYLAFSSPFMAHFFLLQLAAYLIAAVYPVLPAFLKKYKIIVKISSLLWYFCVGNWGQCLGLIDFAGNKNVTKWDPRKDDTTI